MTEKIGVLGTKTPQRTGVERVVNAPLPTVYGKFQAVGYMDHDRGDEQVALVYGEIGTEDVLTRLHSECLTGDAFGSQHCECGDQLASALRAVVAEGRGVVVYLRGHEGRGIGLLGKLRAMALQAEGLDTVEANVALGFPVDARDYKVAADILRDLGVDSVRLMSNNPRKREALVDNGIRVAEEVPLLIEPCENNITYLRTKRERLDHRLPHLDAVAHWS
ncbi:GTP cyclohydrolase II [Streptomyces sp. NBC_00080]|uniref:GTP cyclohydrolase II n=1 Tax=Streptomyces TaxID=1883 RepID=UPI00039D97DF|nr:MULTISPECIES: GTP cyclohydrolase II [Streptomyces]KPI27840.1 GTP cyclohydrolase-2 [Actinobacteria bacterium OV320]TQJ56837.1 GTP cyclohydrolase II [Streptomyces sp. SLBN-115]WSN43658.1 GTP cyclohydrolase II [Streptomyces sp. NBC_01334]